MILNIIYFVIPSDTKTFFSYILLSNALPSNVNSLIVDIIASAPSLHQTKKKSCCCFQLNNAKQIYPDIHFK